VLVRVSIGIHLCFLGQIMLIESHVPVLHYGLVQPSKRDDTAALTSEVVRGSSLRVQPAEDVCLRRTPICLFFFWLLASACSDIRYALIHT
jgi:hypothetical protein